MKLKPIWKFIFTILIIAIIILFLYSYFRKENNSNKETNNNYSAVYLKIKDTKFYNEKNKTDYDNIIYLEKENFIENISTLLDKGYSGEEINHIYELSDNNITILLNMDYINISKYYKIKNYNANNTERYEIYLKDNISVEDAVTRVNINLDLKPYSETKKVENPNDYLVLVNKYNYLDTNYKPDDLVTVKGYYGTASVRKVAAEALEKLLIKGKEDGITLLPTTAFRSASFQATLYNNYVSEDGVESADTYSARPGYSEHQTGLAIDLKDPNLSKIRLDEKDYTWLKTNCADYGFIIRFPENKEDITLYQEENWHIRYVGVEVAKIIMKNKLTLEEYIDLYIKEY